VFAIGRYTYRSIDNHAALFVNGIKKTSAVPSSQEEYDQLKATLAQSGWISEGYVQDRGPGAGGPCYQWTRKVKGKTVSVALSKSNTSGLARQLPTGTPCKRRSAKCNVSAAECSSPPFRTSSAANRSAMKLWGCLKHHSLLSVGVVIVAERDLSGIPDAAFGLLQHFGPDLLGRVEPFVFGQTDQQVLLQPAGSRVVRQIFRGADKPAAVLLEERARNGVHSSVLRSTRSSLKIRIILLSPASIWRFNA